MRVHDLLLPCFDTDAELEFVEYQEAYDEWWWALEQHPAKKCDPSLAGEHCMACQHLTGDPHYTWRRLMIINRNPTRQDAR